MIARLNPFRVERIESLQFRFDEGDLDEFITKLSGHRYRGAIVGPHGTGKTTLMLELCAALKQRESDCSYLRLSDQGRRCNQRRLTDWLEATSTQSILLLDSAGQLNWWDWKKFQIRTRAYRGLIITTHHAGRLPTLINCRSSIQQLSELVEELAPASNISPDRIAAIHHRHQGNLRECLRMLYDESALD